MCISAKWMTLLLVLAITGCAGNQRWNATPLSFVPTAINDAGVIVGNDAANGPVSFQNGTVTVLPPLSGVSGPFAAVDVASNGAILGSTGDPKFPGMFWLSGGVQIPLGPAPVGFFVPKAVNRHVAVAGSAFDALKAYKWTANAIGYTELLLPATLPPGQHDTRATDINDAGFVVGFAIKPPAGPAHIIRWSAGGTPTLLDNLNSIFSDPHILNNGAVYWMNGGSIIRNLGGTSTFQQPPQVDSLNAISQAGRLAGTKTVNGVRHGWTSYEGHVDFLDLPNAPNGDFFRPVDINTCGNNIVGVHMRPNGEVVGGVLFGRQSFLIFQQCDVPPVLTTQ
jgi:hypothetical protein